MDSLPDIGQEISPNGSLLISSAAGPGPVQPLAPGMPYKAGSATYHCQFTPMSGPLAVKLWIGSPDFMS